METNFILRFQYSETEFIKAYRELFTSNKKWIVDLLISVGLMAIALYLIFTDEVTILNTLALIIAILYFIILILKLYIIPLLVFRRTPKYRDTYTLAFTDEQIKFVTEGNQSDIRWDYYNTLKETGGFIFLYYGKDLFTIIPKRVFKDEKEISSFIAFTKKKISK
ncbi:hypothetical protein GMD78_20565 [Ornithinibacillus sp. L9]|uniref:YcxB-like C-terminal domain-containing protein n=1 Tax=Ornithinibacillus caprae TaxID=2678566 RepID=A0A6N8FN48_9BACI|nr:YcxB family protein [Ornithinibacillus caprae]MUK90753.1 hypothetical protein [Ornithinibacillus caprae]